MMIYVSFTQFNIPTLDIMDNIVRWLYYKYLSFSKFTTTYKELYLKEKQAKQDLIFALERVEDKNRAECLQLKRRISRLENEKVENLRLIDPVFHRKCRNMYKRLSERYGELATRLEAKYKVMWLWNVQQEIVLDEIYTYKLEHKMTNTKVTVTSPIPTLGAVSELLGSLNFAEKTYINKNHE